MKRGRPNAVTTIIRYPAYQLRVQCAHAASPSGLPWRRMRQERRAKGAAQSAPFNRRWLHPRMARARPATGTAEAGLTAARADPRPSSPKPDDGGGNAAHNGPRRNVVAHHRACAHHGPRSDGDAGQDNGMGPQPDVVPDRHRLRAAALVVDAE